MALIYKNQARLEALHRKLGAGVPANARMSDMEASLFSDPGSGQKRKSDELAYYRAQNGDAVEVNKKMADAGLKFWSANGGDSSGRADEVEHTFYNNGNFV